ncbi:hypothetical protein KR222_005904 [Zaprionus bogoriensis]|nr:hypothetical protein KR222_005904 [Zaprionus bogoriensis]
MSQAVGEPAPRKEVTGLHRMNQKGLRDLCKKHKLYQTPRLNDVLYLHYQGYQYIECLEEYTELKSLWLECNAISEIEGLDKQSKLKCLFLQNNLIKRIENLACCPELDTLNLSSNHIRKIENISSDILPVLNTLNISSNYLKDSEALIHLVECKTLAVLDLSNNRIDDILVVKIFEQMPNLKVLVLQGNPVVSRLPQYRKTLILSCKELTYLDSRPVFPRDRACAEAWKKDGYEGERRENMRWNRADRKKMRDSVNYTIKLRNRHRPPDQQDALQSSTDSETEQEKNQSAEKTRVKVNAEYGCVDDMWTEVEEKKETDKESSGSTGSEDNASIGSHADEIAEQISSRHVHNLAGRPRILNESQLPENELLESEQQETIKKDPEPSNDDGESPKNATEPLNKDSEKSLDNVAETSNKNSEPSKHDEESLETTVEPFDTATEPLKDDEESPKSINDALKEPTPEEILQKSVDSMYEHYGKEVFAEHTESIDKLLQAEMPCFELEPKVCSVIPRRPDEVDTEDQAELPKTKEQLDYEEECAEANDKVEYDMEELSSHLEEDLDELKEPLKILHEESNVLTLEADDEEEERNRCNELSAAVRSLRITEEFNVRRERMAEGMMKQKENEERILIEEIKSEEYIEVVANDTSDAIDLAFAKALDNCSEDVPTRVFGAGCDTPSHEWDKEECLRQLSVKENDADDEYKVQPLTSRTSAEEADEICEMMNKRLAKDEVALRTLLKELEDEADELYDIDSAVEENVDDDIKPESLTMGQPGEQAEEPKAAIPSDVDEMEDSVLTVEMVCISLLDDLVDELQYQEIISGQNIKCFDFGLIESDEEYSYSAEPNVKPMVPPELENPAGGKSVRECVNTFGDFLTSVKERQHLRKLEKKDSTSSEKVRAAKELLKSKTPFDLTPKQVDVEFAKFEEKTKRRVAAMASRCFEKRENYDDSLEVVDNRLMIVKKNTGALEELPPPPALISDTESEPDGGSEESDEEAYDTAEEQHEAVMDQLSRPYTSRGLWAKPGQPEEDVEPNALTLVEERKEEEDNLLTRSLDQFYSLEARSAFNSLDTEFLDKLDLQKVIGSDGEITEEGMRTCNELQEKSEFTQKEQAAILLEEDEMFKGLIERKRKQEERERQQNEVLEGEEKPTDLKKLDWKPEEGEYELKELPNPDEVAAIKLSLGSCKIYEVKSQLPETIEDNKEETEVEQAQDQEAQLEEKQIAEKEVQNEDSDSEIMEKSDERATVSSVVKSLVPQNAYASIDDDILSDTSTDYESSEDIPVIEPPKLPKGALNDYFCNQLEDGFKHDLECEEALRQELLSLNSGNWTKHDVSLAENISESELNQTTEGIQITEVTSELENDTSDVSIADPETTAKEDQSVPSSDTEVEGAIGERAVSAMEQWAKISKKLHEFIDADDMKLLDEREFNDDNTEDEDDGLLLQDLESLGELEAIVEEQKNSEAENPNLGPIENQDSIDNSEQPSCSKNSKPTITLEYFDAAEPGDVEVDFDKVCEVKTEQIECNLEILNDDGDAVVKEVSVNAQVTYEFK